MIKILLAIPLLINTALAAPLFSSNELIKVELSYDIIRLQKDKEQLRENGLDGQLKHDGDLYPVEILSRGHGSFGCQQPQIKVKFNKKENDNTAFAKLKKVKLFTSGACLDNKTDAEQDKIILSNYLNYKLLESITEYSFKTRLLKISYTDSSGVIPPYTQYGFFLEPKKNLQKRLKLTYIEKSTLPNIVEHIPNRINKELLGLVNAFEFFVGNYDYGIPGFYSHIINDSGYPSLNYMEKNSKLYEAESGEVIPFIYDFDLSRLTIVKMFPGCRMGYSFFLTGADAQYGCTPEKLNEMFNEDLVKFKFSDDVITNKDKIFEGARKWQIDYAHDLEKLGDKYNQELNLLIEAFGAM